MQPALSCKIEIAFLVCSLNHFKTDLYKQGLQNLLKYNVYNDSWTEQCCNFILTKSALTPVFHSTFYMGY